VVLRCASLDQPAVAISDVQSSQQFRGPGQYVGFSGYEGVAQGAIHFAGEHCSQDFQGYMEGGASEGVRAANEILTALK
jgi:monoamine oxidase